MGKNNVIAGLEMAHAKLRMVILENGSFLYASEVDCLDGIKKGVIINLDNVTEAIVKLLENISQKTDKKRLNSILVNISGLNIKQEVVNSVLTLPQRGYEITKRNVDDLIESCKIVSIPLDRSLLYFSPLEYVIDGQEGIKDPVGLCGNRLEAKIFIITAPFNQVQNIIKAVNSAGLEVEEVVLTTLANSHSILSMEEKKEGVLLIDFKSDLTEVSIFKELSLVFFETISKGQEELTNEIADHFNIPFELAEELKIKYGFLAPAQQDRRNQETIPLEWMGISRQVIRGELNRLISEHTVALFDLILEGLKRLKNFNNIIKKGAVLSGGCTSMEAFLEGVVQRFGFTARTDVLRQREMQVLGVSYATSLGLAKFGFEKRLRSKAKGEGGFFKKVYQKADELLTEYF